MEHNARALERSRWHPAASGFLMQRLAAPPSTAAVAPARWEWRKEKKSNGGSSSSGGCFYSLSRNKNKRVYMPMGLCDEQRRQVNAPVVDSFGCVHRGRLARTVA